MMADECGCSWASSDPEMKKYHDEEWGKPVHDDRLLFEFLILEGAQAGLSWKTVLLKRDAYRKAFDNFEPEKVAQYDDKKAKELMSNAGIIRNWRKIEAAVNNAKGVMRDTEGVRKLRQVCVGIRRMESPSGTNMSSMSEIPTESKESRSLSKDLKKRGFSFVGPTIMLFLHAGCGISE